MFEQIQVDEKDKANGNPEEKAKKNKWFGDLPPVLLQKSNANNVNQIGKQLNEQKEEPGKNLDGNNGNPGVVQPVDNNEQPPKPSFFRALLSRIKKPKDLEREKLPVLPALSKNESEDDDSYVVKIKKYQEKNASQIEARQRRIQENPDDISLKDDEAILTKIAEVNSKDTERGRQKKIRQDEIIQETDYSEYQAKLADYKSVYETDDDLPDKRKKALQLRAKNGDKDAIAAVNVNKQHQKRGIVGRMIAQKGAFLGGTILDKALGIFGVNTGLGNIFAEGVNSVQKPPEHTTQKATSEENPLARGESAQQADIGGGGSSSETLLLKFVKENAKLKIENKELRKKIDVMEKGSANDVDKGKGSADDADLV